MQRRPAILLATVLTIAAGAGLAAAATSGPSARVATGTDDVVGAAPARTKHATNHGTVVVYVDDPVTGQPTPVVVGANPAPDGGAPTDASTPAGDPSATTAAPSVPNRSGSRSTTPTTRASGTGSAPSTVTTAPSATAPPTTVTTAPAATTTTRPSGVPADWPPDKPIPPKPANCKQGQLEDNGVWNCQH